MAESTLKIKMEKISGSATGTEAPGAISETVKEGTNKDETSFFKKAKNVPKQIASFSKSQLGIQFGIGAMLKQSQIATGFLGALFQVMGAIMDAFLVAFAPQFFSAISSLSKLIPVVKEMGTELAYSMGDLRERISSFLEPLIPVAIGIWKMASAIARFVESLPQGVKSMLIWVAIGWKLLNFFQVKYFTMLGVTLFKAQMKADKLGSAKSSGVGSIMKMFPAAQIIMIAAAVFAATAAVATAWFSRDKGKKLAEGVDVSGQLGRSYGMSQASQLGTTLNEELSKKVQVFGDGLAPITENVRATAANMTTPLEDALGRTATGMDQTIGLYKGTASKISDKVQAWLDESRKKNPPTPPPAPKPSDSRLTSIGGGAYTGIGSGSTSNEVIREIRQMGNAWAHEQRLLTDLQKQNARQAARFATEEAARAEARQNVWLSNQGIDEGIDA
mgnify:FL=1